MRSYRAPKHYMVGALAYSPVVNSKAPLLKTPHTQVIEHEDSKLLLTWKPHTHWLAFTVLAGAMQATRTEKSSSITASCELCELQ